MKTIAIFLHGQAGDIMEASSVLHYRNELWGDHKLVWYAAKENFDLFKYQDIEVREFPRGFGYPEMVIEENRKLIEKGEQPVWADWQPLVDENNHMRIDLKHNYPELSDIDYGYFPAPHQIPIHKRRNLEYSNCSKKVFGVADGLEWHPVLTVTEKEKQDIMKWFPPYHALRSKIGGGFVMKKHIAIESFCGSGQSLLDGLMIEKAMQICRQALGECYFVFVSHKYLNGDETFPKHLIEDKDVFFASQFTVRQCSYIANCCQLLISTSSGVTVASCCWENKENPKPILQFCGSKICSTSAISHEGFELVTYDNKVMTQAQDEFYDKLKTILNQIK